MGFDFWLFGRIYRMGRGFGDKIMGEKWGLGWCCGLRCSRGMEGLLQSGIHLFLLVFFSVSRQSTHLLLGKKNIESHINTTYKSIGIIRFSQSFVLLYSFTIKTLPSVTLLHLSITKVPNPKKSNPIMCLWPSKCPSENHPSIPTLCHQNKWYNLETIIPQFKIPSPFSHLPKTHKDRPHYIPLSFPQPPRYLHHDN